MADVSSGSSGTEEKQRLEPTPEELNTQGLPSLPPSLPPLFRDSLSLSPSLPPSLPHSLTHSLTHSLPPFLPPSLSPSHLSLSRSHAPSCTFPPPPSLSPDSFLRDEIRRYYAGRRRLAEMMGREAETFTDQDVKVGRAAAPLPPGPHPAPCPRALTPPPPTGCPTLPAAHLAECKGRQTISEGVV